MRASSRSFSNVTFILVLAGTGALLVLLLVLTTGGFVVDAGALHFSSRRWTTPLGLAVAAWVGALFAGGRRGAAEAMTALGAALDRHAMAAAVLVAVAAAGTGIGVGTYAASGPMHPGMSARRNCWPRVACPVTNRWRACCRGPKTHGRFRRSATDRAQRQGKLFRPIHPGCR